MAYDYIRQVELSDGTTKSVGSDFMPVVYSGSSNMHDLMIQSDTAFADDSPTWRLVLEFQSDGSTLAAPGGTVIPPTRMIILMKCASVVGYSYIEQLIVPSWTGQTTGSNFHPTVARTKSTSSTTTGLRFTFSDAVTIRAYGIGATGIQLNMTEFEDSELVSLGLSSPSTLPRLTTAEYGESLPPAGIQGRIFFKKVSD